MQISYDSYQDTTDKPMDPDPAASDMFEYLTVNSTSLETNGNTISDVLSKSYILKQTMQERIDEVWMH